MDTLANMQVGGTASGAPNTYVAYRFRAVTNSQVKSIHLYVLDQRYSGYGGGNGGTLRIDIVPEVNGVPSSKVLGSVTVKPSGSDFPTWTFSPAVPVSAGTVYDIVFTNVDPNPTVNFVSLDLSYTYDRFTPRQPGTADAHFGALRKFGSGSWAVAGGYTPIVDILYANGARQGNGYMEVEVRNPVRIGGGNTARERFTVSGSSRTVRTAAVRVARTSGSGTLTMRLESADGTLIDSCTVDASSVPTASATSDSRAGVWLTCDFATDPVLANGRTYNLRVTATNSLWSRGIQQGDSYGFKGATYFADGLLQVSSNGGSSWSTVSGLAASGDLQFWLR